MPAAAGSRGLPVLGALAAGALLPLGLAPFELWPATALAVAAWFWLATRAAGGAWLGYGFGLGKYGFGTSWIYVSIHDYGNAPPWLAALLVALFVAGMSLFCLAQGWLYARLRGCPPERLGGWLRAAGLFTAVWLLFEWLLTWVLTGFPWLYAGYSQLATPLAGLAPVGGVLLVSVALVLSSTALAALAAGWRTRRAATGGLGAALVLLPWLAGALASAADWTQPVSRHRAVLVQGNIDQAIKWQPASREPIVRRYLELTAPHWGAELILWPEAAITLFEHQAQPLLERLDRRAAASGTALVLGLPGLERWPGGRTVFRNMAVAVGAGEGRYVKRRLVPFGEYVPLEGMLRGVIDFFDLPMSRAEPGDWRQPLLRVQDQQAVMAICYEIVYPGLVRTPPADLLLTISNDAWFGGSIGPHQHLQMARMRALENGRWLLRATNNGVTAAVDHRGRVQASLPQFEAGALATSYEIRDGRTPFARWGSLWLVLLGGAAVVALAWRRR